MPLKGGVYVSLRDPEKTEHTAQVIRRYVDFGYKLYASSGTAEFLEEHGMQAAIADEPGRVKVAIASGQIRIVINVPREANKVDSDAFKIRRYAAEHQLPVLTCIDTAEAFLIAIEKKRAGFEPEYRTLEEYTALA
jgi:carbamoyl-phosphate synthase large subunit